MANESAGATMPEDLKFQVGLEDNGSVKNMRGNLKGVEDAGVKAGQSMEKVGFVTRTMGKDFLSVSANAKALVGNAASMASQFALIGVVMAGIHKTFQAINEETARMKAGVREVAQEALQRMNVQAQIKSGVTEAGAFDTIGRFGKDAESAGLTMTTESITTAAQTVGPIAKQQGIALKNALDSALLISLRTGQSMEESAKLLAKFYEASDEDKLGVMRSLPLSEVEKKNLMANQGMGMSMVRAMAQGTEGEKAYLLQQSNEAQKAENVQKQGEEVLKQANLAEQRRLEYQRTYGIDPRDFNQMYLHGRLRDYLEFAKEDPTNAYAGQFQRENPGMTRGIAGAARGVLNTTVVGQILKQLGIVEGLMGPPTLAIQTDTTVTK